MIKTVHIVSNGKNGWGGSSLRLSIPKDMAFEVGIKLGSTVLLTVTDGKILIIPEGKIGMKK